MTKKRAKPKRTVLRFRKNDPSHNLLAAVQRWLIAEGGDAIMVGGIEIQTWPGESEYRFRVAVGCTGRKPQKATPPPTE